ncbi:haloacid dehalogenase-like hydrolase [Lysobacter arenosi]|uniref:Haloacid dehalogenase-like hydrolase n=1 Tax=Lysobacter arenosi TaxID=2795387 RepID=A0ABX7RAK7_9GAMM|nr:HAD family hydrolase [Lysobacter arenosi]QSX75173.1 haloacid dehalogenase-like hydrolase [Lysobacter arenosi]
MTDPVPTVVFDFDLTLTRWDTADRFFRWLLKRQAWRLALVLLPLPALAPLLLIRGTRKWPVRYAVWVATLGRSHDDLRALAREHTDALFAIGPPVFLADGLAQLQHHLDQSDRVVIATGCLEVLARELLERAGYGHVPLVGSSLKPWLGGMVRHEHCFGANKPPMLSRLGFAPPWAIAYTDHQCDLPVLELSTQRFLVNPKPDAIRTVERALVQQPTVLQWR